MALSHFHSTCFASPQSKDKPFIISGLQKLRWFGKALVVCLVAMATTPVQAQMPSPEQSQALGTQSDPAATKLLATVRDKYAAYEAMRMDFILDIIDLETKDTETREGRFAVSGTSFRFSMPGQVLVCDGQTLWTYMEDVHEVQVNEWEPDQQDFMSPAELFQLPESEYIALSGERNGSGADARQAIELSPRDRELEIHKIRLIVHPTSGELLEATVMDRNAIHFRYRIKNFEGDPELPAEFFTFDADAYDGITVVDLR